MTRGLLHRVTQSISQQGLRYDALLELGLRDFRSYSSQAPLPTTMRDFYKILFNTLFASVSNFFVWFAITFWLYLETKSVMATSFVGGSYLVITSVSGFWLGSIVDHWKKKHAMMLSSAATAAIDDIRPVLGPTKSPRDCLVAERPAAGKPMWFLGTLRAVLTSSQARPCVDLELIAAKEAESPTFRKMFPRVCKQLGRRFRLVTGDAGLACRENAALVREWRKDYAFAVKGNQPTLHALAQSLLWAASCEIRTEERVNGKTVVRELARVRSSQGTSGWSSLTRASSGAFGRQRSRRARHRLSTTATS